MNAIKTHAARRAPILIMFRSSLSFFKEKQARDIVRQWRVLPILGRLEDKVERNKSAKINSHCFFSSLRDRPFAPLPNVLSLRNIVQLGIISVPNLQEVKARKSFKLPERERTFTCVDVHLSRPDDEERTSCCERLRELLRLRGCVEQPKLQPLQKKVTDKRNNDCAYLMFFERIFLYISMLGRISSCLWLI